MDPRTLILAWIFGGFVYAVLLANGFYKGEWIIIREHGVRWWLGRDGGDWIAAAIMFTVYHTPLLILVVLTVWAVAGWL